MKFKDFTDFLERIEAEASRNSITEILAEMWQDISIEECGFAAYFLTGSLLPAYKGLEFNFSTKLVIKALSEKHPGLEEEYKSRGDIGLAVEVSWGENSTELSISNVYKELTKLANLEGKGSQQAKSEMLSNLLEQIGSKEAKYIVRIVAGKMRLGLNSKTILDSLSWAVTGDKSIKKQIERAYGAKSDIGEIAKLVLENKEDKGKLLLELENIKITPGIPVASKLVERVKEIEEVGERMTKFYVQPKLDGLRAQIHFENGVCEIYSRNQERLTDMFPELVEEAKLMSEKTNAKSFVLDSEAIGFDKATGEYLPFQQTIKRKRKHDVADTASDIPVKAMCFDVLYFNGEDISHTPIESRVKILEELMENGGSENYEMLDTQVFDTVDDLSMYFEEQVGKGLEGVIVKNENTFYEPGTRNYDWIKIKASIKSSMVDTVDAVVMGYYLGTGARSKFGIGAILIGLYNESTEKYESLAKVGTGITDELFGQVKSDLDKIQIRTNTNKDLENLNYDIDRTLVPDILVNPEIVVVVEADEVTRSKTHKVAFSDENGGISLRFPRLKVWNREDKNVDQVTSIKEIESMVK